MLTDTCTLDIFSSTSVILDDQTLDVDAALSDSCVDSDPENDPNDVLITHRTNQWEPSWINPSTTISKSNAHHHMAKAFKHIKSIDLKTHLKGTSLMLKAIFGEISAAKASNKKSIADIVTDNGKELALHKKDYQLLTKIQASLDKRITNLEVTTNSMDVKLDLLIYILSPDDGPNAKKREKIVQQRCSLDYKFKEEKMILEVRCWNFIYSNVF